MKRINKLLLIGISFTTCVLQAQVGINTEMPEATLDVNGDTRIQQADKIGLQENREVDEALKKYDDCPCLLVIENDGKVRRVAISETNLSGDKGTTGGTVESIANLGDEASATIENQTSYVASIVYAGGEYQGMIDDNVNKILIRIPYTNGDGGTYQTATSKAETVGASSENDASSDISMTIKGGTLENGAGYLIAEVTTPATFNIKKLDAKATQRIADFKFMLGGQEHTVTLMAIGAIPDKNYGDGLHDFLYLPVMVTNNNYSKVWLNYNLGAEYTKIGSPDFSLEINKSGAEAHGDKKLYGSLYQWQRPSDGHEFRSSETIETQATDWTSNAPTEIEGKFIYNVGTNWVNEGYAASGENIKLWKAGKQNNPCPKGFHVPTQSEWQDLQEAITGSRTPLSNNKMWVQNILPNFVATGYRDHNTGELKNEGQIGYYWTSDYFNGASSNRVVFESNRFSAYHPSPRAIGMNVRCVQD